MSGRPLGRLQRLSIVGLAIAALAGPAAAQGNDDLKARLDAALKTIEDLQSRVKALEAVSYTHLTLPTICSV